MKLNCTCKGLNKEILKPKKMFLFCFAQIASKASTWPPRLKAARPQTLRRPPAKTTSPCQSQTGPGPNVAKLFAAVIYKCS